MKELFWNTIADNMRLILCGFSRSEIGARFYLGGGTALALERALILPAAWQTVKEYFIEQAKAIGNSWLG